MDNLIEITLAPLALLLVQAIKAIIPNASKYSVPVIIVIAGLLSTLVVDWTQHWQTALLALASLTYQIASMASGTYSWKPTDKTVTVQLSNYEDIK